MKNWKVIQRFDKYIGRLVRDIRYVSVASMGMLALGVILHVTMRYLFNNPLTWGEDMAKLLTILIVLASVPWLFYIGGAEGHVCIDVVMRLLPTKTRSIVRLVVHLASIIFLVFWSRFVFLSFLTVYTRNVRYDTIRSLVVWPEFLFFAIILALSVLVLFLNLVKLTAETFFSEQEQVGDAK